MLTFRIVFRRKNGRNHRIPLYPSHTELHGCYCHSNTLKTEIKKNNNDQTSVIFQHFCCAILTLLDLQLARLTGATVTHLNTGVLATVQQGAACFLAAERRTLAAARRLTGKKPKNVVLVLTPEDNLSDLMESGLPDLPTDTGFCDKGRTLWTRPRMT